MSSGRTPIVIVLRLARSSVSRSTLAIGGAELDAALGELGREQVHGGAADEAGDEHVLRLLVQVARGADLLQDAVLQHGDAVAHREGLGLVVRDVDRGDAEAALERRDLGAGLHAQLGVEVRQRLVHEEHLRLTHDRAAHGDALTLTTGERLRLAAEVGLEVEQLGGLEDALGALLLADAGDLEREAHVLGDGHVRVQRVVLEDHRDVAVLRRDVGDVAIADQDAAVVDLFEAGEHAQRGRLAAAGRDRRGRGTRRRRPPGRSGRRRGGWSPGRGGLPCRK